MNTDNDYDNDGNNIVPCPICLSAHCPSKEGGKCPDEDEFVEAMNQSQPEWEKQYFRTFAERFKESQEPLYEDIKEFIRSLLLKARTAEQERVVGIANGMRKDIPTRQIHWLQTINKSNRRIARKKADSYNQALTDITEAIRGNENEV